MYDFYKHICRKYCKPCGAIAYMVNHPKIQGCKTLYLINDVKMIAFVNYLATVKKIKANGRSYLTLLFSERYLGRSIFLWYDIRYRYQKVDTEGTTQ